MQRALKLPTTRSLMLADLIEEPAVRNRAVPMTAEAYHLLGEAGLIPEHVELLEGLVVEKMPKSPLHVFVTEKLARDLRGFIGTSTDWYVREEKPLTFGNSEPEPDLAVVRGQAENYLATHPSTAEFAVEVAVSSLGLDRRKASIYAAAGVREYWIVLPEERQVEIYTSPQGRDYAQHQVFTAPTRVESTVLADFRVDLTELFPS